MVGAQSRSTVNGNGARHRQKSLPTASPNALFRSRARFRSILGSPLGRRTASLGRLSADFRDFFVISWAPVGSHVVFLCSRVLGEGAGSDFGCLGTLLGRILAGIWVISCITPVVRGAQVLSQLRPKFGQISDQSVFRRRFFPLLALPFS